MTRKVIFIRQTWSCLQNIVYYMNVAIEARVNSPMLIYQEMLCNEWKNIYK